MNICKKSLNVIMMLFILFNICACKNENKISESYPKIYDYLDSITIDTFKNQIKKLSVHQVEEFLLVAKVSWLV